MHGPIAREGIKDTQATVDRESLSKILEQAAVDRERGGKDGED